MATIMRIMSAAGLMAATCGCAPRPPAPLIEARERAPATARYGYGVTGGSRDEGFRDRRQAIVSKFNAAIEPPGIDIGRTCEDGRQYSASDKDLDFRACVKDETDAKARVANLWPTLSGAVREDCAALGQPPTPRYVEVLTCIQINSGGIKPIDAITAAPAAAKSSFAFSSTTALSKDPMRQGL